MKGARTDALSFPSPGRIRRSARARAPTPDLRCETLAPDVDELQQIQGHLHDLARSKPTVKRRDEVEALLGSKWEGVQVSAAHVLAAWGGPQSVSALRRWLGEEEQTGR